MDNPSRRHVRKQVLDEARIADISESPVKLPGLPRPENLAENGIFRLQVGHDKGGSLCKQPPGNPGSEKALPSCDQEIDRHQR